MSLRQNRFPNEIVDSDNDIEVTFFQRVSIAFDFIVSQTSEIARENFIAVYAPDSYDIASDKINSKPSDMHTSAALDSIHRYRRDPFVMFSSFIGLSNYYNDLELQSYTDEPEDYSKKKLKKDVFGSFSGFFKNLISVIVTTPHSIAKLFTEFLPLFASAGFGNLAGRCWKRGGAFYIPFALATFFGLLFNAIYFVGRAVTSPIESVRNAWFFWVPAHKPKTFTGVMLGLIFATASILITMTIYALLFSLIAPSLGLGAAQLAFMTPQASSAFAFIGSKIMLPMLAHAGAAISPVVAGFTTILGAGLGFVLGTVGPVVNDIVHWCQDKLRRRAEPKILPRAAEKLNDAHADMSDVLNAMRELDEANENHEELRRKINNPAPQTFHAEPGTTANSGMFSGRENQEKTETQKRLDAYGDVIKKIHELDRKGKFASPEHKQALIKLAGQHFRAEQDFAEFEKTHLQPLEDEPTYKAGLG
jgi:hypothetical protein